MGYPSFSFKPSGQPKINPPAKERKKNKTEAEGHISRTPLLTRFVHVTRHCIAQHTLMYSSTYDRTWSLLFTHSSLALGNHRCWSAGPLTPIGRSTSMSNLYHIFRLQNLCPLMCLTSQRDSLAAGTSLALSCAHHCFSIRCFRSSPLINRPLY